MYLESEPCPIYDIGQYEYGEGRGGGLYAVCYDLTHRSENNGLASITFQLFQCNNVL